MFLQMSVAERNELIAVTARGWAAERYRESHPGCTERSAWAWAARHWRAEVEGVIDWLAVCTALEEVEAAAPSN